MSSDRVDVARIRGGYEDGLVSRAIVVVGASLGGLSALGILLDGLPAGFGPPVAVVQHRSPLSARGLLSALQAHSKLPLREPCDKERIVGGAVYLAPPDYHLLIEDGHFALSTDAPVTYARPSIDVLFESAADAYGSGVIAVVLTGASADGARGAYRVRERGGVVIVQNPETAECPVMPKAALGAASPGMVLCPECVAEAVVQIADPPEADPSERERAS